jgi:hypothetical protein
MNASRFVFELIAKRREVTKDPDLLGWLDVLEAAVRPGLKRRPWEVIEDAKGK